jgi:hypothetical protein
VAHDERHVRARRNGQQAGDDDKRQQLRSRRQKETHQLKSVLRACNLHSSMAVRGCYAALAAVLVVAGCSPSPQKAASDARQAAGSWGATLSAAAERWGSGEISTRYFESVVTQARTALQAESQTARKSAGDAAAKPVDAVASHLDAISDAAKRGDRPAAIDAAHAAASSVEPQKTPPVARP